MNSFKAIQRTLLCSLVLAIYSQDVFATTPIADSPMAIRNSVKANVMTVFDNSQSMDAFLSGTLVSPATPGTRSNLGKSIMSSTITNYKTNFRWGLMTFETQNAMNNIDPYNTYVYFMGSDPSHTNGITPMGFTDDCTINDPTFGMIGMTSTGKKCARNVQPNPANGEHYITYAASSDDPDVLDAFYLANDIDYAYLNSSGGTNYNVYLSKTKGSGWNGFSNCLFSGCNSSFSYTDSGFLPNNPPYTRQYWAPRGVGYNDNITGFGKVLVPSDDDTVANHTTSILNYLRPSTNTRGTTEIKNSAIYTPLAGTLTTAKRYFANTQSGTHTPIIASCQKNYVMLVTDGLPTGTTGGALYSEAQRTNTYNATTHTWNFGQAATDTFASIQSLRSTSYGGINYNIETYVLALGAGLQNDAATAVMNQMAAYGGTNTAYQATDAETFKGAIQAITQDILAKEGAAAAVTVSNPNVVAGDNSSYNSTYNSGTWTGELQAYPVNLTTGTIDTTSPSWSPSAQARLDAKGASNRAIATYDGTTGIQFQPASASTSTKLSALAQALFISPTNPPGGGTAGTAGDDSLKVISYLRGDKTNEGSLYRPRAHLLGDIINAEPVLVQKPTHAYTDECYAYPSTGCPTPYVTAKASRPRIIFQPANDGLIHAFDATNGDEKWAYLPKLLWPTASSSNIVDITRLAGFAHKYYADATPQVADVDFNNVAGVTTSPDWHTILVGGLGKGGRGYYALDVTDPSATSEADAASKVLWEFPNASTPASVVQNMGYSYGRPVIGKLPGYGWVVIVASGYNNGSDTGGDGVGRIYILNPQTGALLKELVTTAGTSANPSGLAKISGFVDNADLNNTIKYVYGGDLLGNVWRFDLTGTPLTGWTAKKLATLVDASNNAQPVTTEPDLATATVAGVPKQYVYVGTGKYLDDTDVPTTSTQSLYGLIDDLSASPTITPLRSKLLQQTLSQTTSTTRTLSSNTINYTTQKGWYVDLSLSPGERVVSDPAVAVGALIVTTDIPSSNVCVPGGSSYVYNFDYATGGFLQNSTVSYSATFLGNALASRPTLVKLPDGTVKAIIRLSDTTTVTTTTPVPPSSSTGRRVSWREVTTN